MPFDIYAYLRSDRNIAEWKIMPDLQRRYGLMHNLIWDSHWFRGFGQFKPPLIITCSSSRSSELINVSDRRYLVYDQHLGTTFNIFNRILLYATDSEPIRTFAFRYLAERFRDRGMLFRALCFAHWHASRSTRKNVPRDGYEHLLMTSLQELFILAHESFHVLLMHDLSRRSHCRPVVNMLIDRELKERSVEHPRVVADIKNDYNINEDEQRTARGYGSSTLTELLKSLRYALEEEVMCDLHAMSLTRELAKEHFGLDDDVITAKAVYAGLRHLHLKMWLDQKADMYRRDGIVVNDPVDENHFFRGLLFHLRMCIIRDIWKHAGVFDGYSAHDASVVHRRLSEMYTKYETVLDDPILFGFDELIEAVAQHEAEARYLESIWYKIEVERDLEVIDQVLDTVNILVNWSRFSSGNEAKFDALLRRIRT